jgi:NADH-quinone oxidoreductase subunit L
MNQLIPLIPILPLIGFVIIGLANRSLSKSLTSIIGCGSVGLSFILALLLFLNGSGEVERYTLYSWISTGNLNVDFSFLVDNLTKLFLLVITGVGTLIHVYSAGYMHDDDGFRRFFAYLNLFVFFMLILVMGDSYLMMFIGWEGVGLCSYLLIGFWFKNKDYSSAAKKAFIMNRIGDLGLLLGMFLIYTQFDSVSYEKVLNTNAVSTVSPSLITLATILLFIGACGKSAQIPLYTWLPDAMAGPTPVSALIHAATMVTAGIYMVARSSVLFAAAPITLNIILVVGLATALFAASIGLYQNDIKKVLAYSTVSQLGLMFAALGVGGFTAAVFHVVTHAFFKALLFLGAGSVIHAMHHEQDIRKMGGLKKALPITYITFLIGTIAISGIPPFAGFFSKDQILAELLYKKGPIVYGIGILVSLFTCYYMFRLLFLTFYGKFRGTEEQKHYLHESPYSMTVPLIVLAFFAMTAGVVGFPHGIGESLGVHNLFDHYLENTVVKSQTHFSASQEWMMIGGVLTLIFGAFYAAYNSFISKESVPLADNEMEGFKNVVYNKYFVDEAYEKIVTNPLDKISGTTESVINNKLLDGAVNGSGFFVRGFGNMFKEIQSGNLGNYLVSMVLAMIAILIFSLI